MYRLLYGRGSLPCRSLACSFSTTPLVRDAVVRSVAEETQDIRAMDNLLKAVRVRSNPAYNSVMPMRSPIPWSETLLNTAPKSGEGEEIQYQAPPDLAPRNMHDSYSEFTLPFGSSAELLEKYTNAHGGIRTGKLMEHLDSLAGSISYKHVLGPGVETLGRIQERGFYIVTASVDRLDMLTALDPSRDLRLSGQVIYTGRSSMEVAVKMENTGGNQPDETVMIGRFSMVCRDAHTHKARHVNTLNISTPEEHSLYSMGEAIKRRRSSFAARSLDRVPPTSNEAAMIHSYYLNHGQEHEHHKERVWIGDTKAEKTMLMFPQERNVHQKVFGGYLMRLAYELGFTNGSMFVRGPMHFLSLDSISFAQPVPIGSILRLSSYIIHSKEGVENHPKRVHVSVTANVVDVKTGKEQTTNEFRFTWCKDTSATDQRGVQRRVVPRTYKETMLWLEGKRALDLGDQIRGLRDHSGRS